MLSDREHGVFRSTLSFFKKKIEGNAHIVTEFDIQGCNANILLVRSAKAELYIDFVEELIEYNSDINLYVLGEKDDKICAYDKNAKINIIPLVTKGKFSKEKLEEYKKLLGNVEMQKIVYLNPSIHSHTIFNVYEVVSELCKSGSDVLKYMGKDKWMGYQSFGEYVRTLRAYMSIYECYEYMVKEVI